MVEQSESSLPQGNQLSLFSRVHLSSTSSILSCRCHGALFSQLQQSFYSEDQLALQESTKKLVDEVAILYFFSLHFSSPSWIYVIFPFWLFLPQVINPYAKEWEAEKIFPAHKVFKKFGEAGLLGIHRFRKRGDSCKFWFYILGMRSMAARAWTTNTTVLFLRPLATATVQELPWQ